MARSDDAAPFRRGKNGRGRIAAADSPGATRTNPRRSPEGERAWQELRSCRLSLGQRAACLCDAAGRDPLLAGAPGILLGAVAKALGSGDPDQKRLRVDIAL
jgi:hypothetical protein